MPKILRLPWYPFFLAAYPILALLYANLGEVKYTAGFRPLVVSMILTFLLFLFLKLIYRNPYQAAVAVAVLVLLFYSYGHIDHLIAQKWKIPHLTAWLGGLWFAFALLALFLASLLKAGAEKPTPGLNAVALVLMLIPAVEVSGWSIVQGVQTSPAPHAPLQSLHEMPGQTLPDIYYIIPEDYARPDVLLKAFDYDDSGFIQSLEGMGFYVANCSQSNYARSELSIGSSLNLDYLQHLDDTFVPNNLDRSHLWNDIRTSAIRVELQNVGYKTVAFATGFAWSEIDNADVYYGTSPWRTAMTGFETTLLRTTLALPLQNLGWVNFDEIDGNLYRQRTLSDFDKIEELAQMPGPKFVFLQIISPHPPFVFNPDGTPSAAAPYLNEEDLYTQQNYTEGYRNQIPF